MSANKQRGTAWETAIVTYLRARGWTYAERRALHGRNDRGDVAGIPGIVIEAKNAARVDLAGWLDEANDEASHFTVLGALTAPAVEMGAVWFKRRGRTSPGEGFVLMDGLTFTRLLIEAGYQK